MGFAEYDLGTSQNQTGFATTQQPYSPPRRGELKELYEKVWSRITQTSVTTDPARELERAVTAATEGGTLIDWIPTDVKQGQRAGNSRPITIPVRALPGLLSRLAAALGDTAERITLHAPVVATNGHSPSLNEVVLELSRPGVEVAQRGEVTLQWIDGTLQLSDLPAISRRQPVAVAAPVAVAVPVAVAAQPSGTRAMTAEQRQTIVDAAVALGIDASALENMTDADLRRVRTLLKKIRMTGTLLALGMPQEEIAELVADNIRRGKDAAEAAVRAALDGVETADPLAASRAIAALAFAGFRDQGSFGHSLGRTTERQLRTALVGYLGRTAGERRTARLDFEGFVELVALLPANDPSIQVTWTDESGEQQRFDRVGKFRRKLNQGIVPNTNAIALAWHGETTVAGNAEGETQQAGPHREHVIVIEASVARAAVAADSPDTSQPADVVQERPAPAALPATDTAAGERRAATNLDYAAGAVGVVLAAVGIMGLAELTFDVPVLSAIISKTISGIQGAVGPLATLMSFVAIPVALDRVPGGRRAIARAVLASLPKVLPVNWSRLVQQDMGAGYAGRQAALAGLPAEVWPEMHAAFFGAQQDTPAPNAGENATGLDLARAAFAAGVVSANEGTSTAQKRGVVREWLKTFRETTGGLGLKDVLALRTSASDGARFAKAANAVFEENSYKTLQMFGPADTLSGFDDYFARHAVDALDSVNSGATPVLVVGVSDDAGEAVARQALGELWSETRPGQTLNWTNIRFVATSSLNAESVVRNEDGLEQSVDTKAFLAAAEIEILPGSALDIVQPFGSFVQWKTEGLPGNVVVKVIIGLLNNVSLAAPVDEIAGALKAANHIAKSA